MKIKNIVLWGVVWGIIYFSTNNINLFTPHTLPFFQFENDIKMNEWFMIPYVSWLLYLLIFCMSIKKCAKQFILLVTSLVSIHALIFLLIPTIYPRTYDPESMSVLSQILLKCDRPQNCLPSLHVSFICFTLLIAPYVGITNKERYLFAAWGAIIIASVVFVKQHYVIDIIAAIFLTSIFFYIFVKLKRPHS